jgi:hypothetical protein
VKQGALRGASGLHVGGCNIHHAHTHAHVYRVACAPCACGVWCERPVDCRYIDITNHPQYRMQNAACRTQNTRITYRDHYTYIEDIWHITIVFIIDIQHLSSICNRHTQPHAIYVHCTPTGL